MDNKKNEIRFFIALVFFTLLSIYGAAQSGTQQTTEPTNTIEIKEKLYGNGIPPVIGNWDVL